MPGLWLCLSLDPSRREPVTPDYTHHAFSVADFASAAATRRAAGVKEWKDNCSEGDSLYFLDPDGHRLEIHHGDLASRLATCRQQPYRDMQFYD